MYQKMRAMEGWMDGWMDVLCCVVLCCVDMSCVLCVFLFNSMFDVVVKTGIVCTTGSTGEK